ncbi:hypothetical protein [Streptomyces sp. NPDC054887]
MTVQPDPQLVADVDAIYHGPTTFRDDTKPPVVGTAPPVPQPGRPPMSQKATDASALMLSVGAGSLLLGGGVSLVMLTSGLADATVIAWICAAPAAVAVPILALSRLLKAAGQAAPAETHQHFNGPVRNTTQNITSKASLWSRTTNQL